MALDLNNSQGQVFGPSGANHAPGLVPDPGSTAGGFNFLREDAVFSHVADDTTGASDPWQVISRQANGTGLFVHGNGTQIGVRTLGNAGVGAFNPIVQSGDNVLIGQGSALGNGILTLTAWGNTAVGIRISAAANTVTTSGNAAFSGGIDNTVIGANTPAAGTFTTLIAQNTTYQIFITGVNFNSANTDYQITVALPAGITNYRIANLQICNASASLTTATWGLFSSTGGGGTTIFAAGQSTTVSTAAANTANNFQLVGAPGNVLYNFTTLQFRIGTPEGSAATANVGIQIFPMF